MSKYINVNPDHYKFKGRERPGDGIVRASNRPVTVSEKTRERWEQRKRQKKKATGNK